MINNNFNALHHNVLRQAYFFQPVHIWPALGCILFHNIEYHCISPAGVPTYHPAAVFVHHSATVFVYLYIFTFVYFHICVFTHLTIWPTLLCVLRIIAYPGHTQACFWINRSHNKASSGKVLLPEIWQILSNFVVCIICLWSLCPCWPLSLLIPNKRLVKFLVESRYTPFSF